MFLVIIFGYAQETKKDWLLDNSGYTSLVIQEGNAIILDNGLVNRTIRIAPNAATIEFKNLTTGESMLRSIKPEAEVTINGKAYAIGGLQGLKEHGYFLEEWLDGLTADPDAFQYKSHEVKKIRPKIKWNPKKRYHTAENVTPNGKELILTFNPLLSD